MALLHVSYGLWLRRELLAELTNELELACFGTVNNVFSHPSVIVLNLFVYFYTALKSRNKTWTLCKSGQAKGGWDLEFLI